MDKAASTGCLSREETKREEMTYSNCAERQILICLFSDSFQLLFTGQRGDRSGAGMVHQIIL